MITSGEISDPKDWSAGANALTVGDTFTEEWLDHFRSLMTAYNEARRDVERLNFLDTLECGLDHEGYGDYHFYSGDSYRDMGKGIRQIIDQMMAKRKRA